MARAPLLVLVTYRPGYRPPWVDKSYATQVALQPLSSQDSLRVVQAVLPAALQAPLVPQLLAKAEGNPFFLEELARTVVEQGAKASSSHGARYGAGRADGAYGSFTDYRQAPAPGRGGHWQRRRLASVAGRDRSA